MKSPLERSITAPLFISLMIGILSGGLLVTLIHGRFTTPATAPAQAAIVEVVWPTATNTPWWEATPSVTPTRTPRSTEVPDQIAYPYVGGVIDQALAPVPTKETVDYCSHFDRVNDPANAGKKCKRDPWDEPTPTPRACETAKSNTVCTWQYREEEDHATPIAIPALFE